MNSPTTGSGPATNREVEITSVNYEIRTNTAHFQDQVVVVQKTGGQAETRLACVNLTLEFSGTNELQRARAVGEVAIERGDGAFRLLKIKPSRSDRWLNLTENIC